MRHPEQYYEEIVACIVDERSETYEAGCPWVRYRTFTLFRIQAH